MEPEELKWCPDSVGTLGSFQACDVIRAAHNWAIDRAAAGKKLLRYKMQLTKAVLPNTKGHPTAVIRHRSELEGLLRHVKSRGEK